MRSVFYICKFMNMYMSTPITYIKKLFIKISRKMDKKIKYLNNNFIQNFSIILLLILDIKYNSIYDTESKNT